MSNPATRTIEIIIAPNGQTRVETKGFVGSSCRTASQFIEQALGARQAERLTSEYFLPQTSATHLQEGA